MRRFPGSFLLLLLIQALAPSRVPGTVLLFAPPGQAGGATDSAGALRESLAKDGVDLVEAETLQGQDLARFQAVFAALGTFPRKHVLTEAEGEALAAYLGDAMGSLYLEGGDAAADLPAALAPLLGVALKDDGAGDLALLEGLDASPGPDLSGLLATYSGENRSIDRLTPVGPGARALWRNSATGSAAGVYRESPEGYRTICVSFEFGGLPGGRHEVLRSCLIALGVLPYCAPAIRNLSSSAVGRRVVLDWEASAALDSILVEGDGGLHRALPRSAVRFEEEPGPGEHVYWVSALSGGCRSPAAFSTAAVIGDAHVIWRPPETLSGTDDSAREVRAALEANGRGAVTVSHLSGLDLRDASGVWAILGTHPFNHQLTEEEGRFLADYLGAGTGPERPRLYIEGGDVWGAGPPTALRAVDGVRPAADAGVRKLRHLRGLAADGLDLAGLVRLPVDYTSETESLDILTADPGKPGTSAAWIDDDSGEVLGVFRRDPAGGFALLSVSFEFGGVTHTGKERALLMKLYLSALEVPRPRFRRGDVDGDGEISITDPIQILGRLYLAGSYDQDCEDAADGQVGLTDVIVLLGHLFLDQAPPAPPGPDRCGSDPTDDDVLPECHPLPTPCG